MNFAEIFEQQADEIVGIGPLGMAGELDALPGVEMRVEIALQLLDFPADAIDVRGGGVGGIGEAAELGNIAFERINFDLAALVAGT